MGAASSKMLKWQYDRLIGQLILLQDHAADPTCPCTLGESGEYCTAKHLLAIQEYAVETMQMVGDEQVKGFLNDLSIEAREHRDREKSLQCGQEVDFHDLAEWARAKRKYLEPLVYKSCEIAQVKNDTIPVLNHVITDAGGQSCQLLKSGDLDLMPWFDRYDGGDAFFASEPIADRGRKLDDLIKQLREGIKAIWDSDNYAAYLRTMSKFHDYSLGNCILIWLQRPDATHVAGFQTWKNLGRYVKKGEKAITILAPCVPAKPKPPVDAEDSDEDQEPEEIEVAQRPLYFKPVSVFDISQTGGDPIADIHAPALSGEVDPSLWHKLIDYGARENVAIDFTPRPDQNPEIKGQYNPVSKDIWIKPDEAKAQQAKTLAHELAHHNSLRATLADRADAETVAESAAFVVCGHFGFDTGVRSFPYVAIWAGEEKRLRNNLSAIRAIADKMIDAMEALPRIAGADELQAELDGLLDDINNSRARGLIKYIKRSGAYKGELVDLTPAQFKEITGKAPNSAIVNKRGKIPVEYAIDDIATELGYKDDTELRRDAERLYDMRVRIEGLQHSLKIAKEKAKEAPACSGMITTVTGCPDPAVEGEECKAKILECDDLNLTAIRHPAHWTVHKLKHDGDDPDDKNQVIDVRYAGQASHEIREIAGWHREKLTH